MKLIRAQFTNFRLLRDLEVPFSAGADRNLTVFRAENETGKTTMLTALQWALYGEAALPNKGQDFRLHPIDWAEEEEGLSVPIEVEVDFEITRHNPTTGGGTREVHSRYRIKRTAREEVTGKDWKRSTPTVHLFHLTETGAIEVERPDLFIADELPPDLREVFFTDGDRALTFIEADVATATKRDRVQRAIKSLLGLGVIGSCQKHVGQVARNVNRNVRKETRDAEIERLAEAIDAAASEIEEWTTRENDASEQHQSFDLKLRDIDKEIEAVLKRGDQEELAAQLARTDRQIQQATDLVASLERRHSGLFKSKRIASGLLSSAIAAAEDQLDDLAQRNEIPSGTVPVLEECLHKGRCVCGDSLDKSAPEGDRKREFIQHLIDETRQSDEHKRILTELFYRSKGWTAEITEGNQSWVDEYGEIFEERDKAERQRDALSKRHKELEAKIDALKDSDIQKLREARRYYEKQKTRFRDDFIRAQTQRRQRESQKAADEARRNGLLKHQRKARRLISDLEVTKDIEDVLENAYQRIQTEEVDKVSTRMNELFMDMIGADPDQGATIKRAEVSRAFDILVYGPGDRMLNPDPDLNGASRRALTIAFILALTDISEVDAPNSIDTPLGMMSGFVKRSVLRIAIDQSSQLILFLTRDEIKGCESIIDKRAGHVVTLTNPAHYPRMLVHRPTIHQANILRCACNHRNECQICERHRQETSESAT